MGLFVEGLNFDLLIIDFHHCGLGEAFHQVVTLQSIKFLIWEIMIFYWLSDWFNLSCNIMIEGFYFS